jgi:hypothetical protein
MGGEDPPGAEEVVREFGDPNWLDHGLRPVEGFRSFTASRPTHPA